LPGLIFLHDFLFPFSSLTQIIFMKSFLAFLSFCFVFLTAGAQHNGTTINYASPFCDTAGIVYVQHSGTAGGSYSSSPSGLSLNSSTGAINLATSQSGTYTVGYNVGTDTVFTQVAIRPTQFFNMMSTQLVCSGSMTSVMNLGSVPGITYAWMNSNSAIGLTDSGRGNIPAFMAMNNGTTDMTARITVRALGGTGCFPTPMVFGIIVAPRTLIDPVQNQVVCAGQLTAPINFTNAQGSVQANWNAGNPGIGTVASLENTSRIPAFIARNPTGDTAVTSIFTVTPVRRGCTGTPTQFTITVRSAVTALSYPRSTYCQNTGAIPILRGSGGGSYSATPGGLDIDPNTGLINFWTSQPGTYTVSYTIGNAQGGCPSTASTQVRVLPRVTVDVPTNRIFACRGATVPAQQFTGTGTSIMWTNSDTSNGLAASGTGSLPSFVAENPTTSALRSIIRVTAMGDGVNNCNSLTEVIYLAVGTCNSGSITQADGAGGDASTLRTQDVTLSPVPARDRVTVQLATNSYTSRETYTVQLVSQYGGAISKPAVMNSSTYTVDLTGLTPGVYTLRITSTRTGQSVQKQLVKY